MKRSQVNRIIDEAMGLISARGLFLPPFGHWDLIEFLDREDDALPIIEAGLGWGVSDFGQGQFEWIGMTEFILRNGSLAGLAGGAGHVYAEKLIILREGQAVPRHTHMLKTEDLINRGGGMLALRICGSDGQGQIDPMRGITVHQNGLPRWLPAGATLRLEPGESATLRPGDWHTFWSEGGDCVVGQISTVLDEVNDNIFSPQMPRFSVIDDDCAPKWLLTTDYAYFLP